MTPFFFFRKTRLTSNQKLICSTLSFAPIHSLIAAPCLQTKILNVLRSRDLYKKVVSSSVALELHGVNMMSLGVIAGSCLDMTSRPTFFSQRSQGGAGDALASQDDALLFSSRVRCHGDGYRSTGLSHQSGVSVQTLRVQCCILRLKIRQVVLQRVQMQSFHHPGPVCQVLLSKALF